MTWLTFAGEANTHPVVDTGGNRDFQFDRVADLALTAAVHARLHNDLAGPTTNRTGGLDTQNTGRLQDLSTPAALLAGGDLAAGFAARTVACLARVATIESKRFGNSPGCFFECQRDVGSDVGPFLAAATSASAKQIAEHAAAATEHLAEGMRKCLRPN